MNAETTLARKEKMRPGTLEKQRTKYGIFFALPWILGLLFFYAFPLFSSIYYSFTDYNIISAPRWVGFENYTRLFNDPRFIRSIQNTVIYALMTVPISVMIGIILSLLLNMSVKFQGFFRTVIFMPTLVPVVATSIIWQWLMNPRFGVVNYLLFLVGIDGPNWFTDPAWSKPTLMLVAQWTIGNAVLIYLAGLQDISTDYYEAADLDGANIIQKTFRITLPLLTPVIFFNLIMGVINTLQIFALPFTISAGLGTPGSPADALLFYSIYLYLQAFGFLNMGYASAMAWIMFIVIVVFTFIVFNGAKGWVHYEEEG